MIAVSALTSYMYCPKKFYLQYVLGLREPARTSTLEGTIMHESADRMQNGINSITLSVTKNTKLTDLEIRYKQAYYLGLFNTINSNEKELTRLSIDKKEIFKKLWKQLLDNAISKARFVFNLSSKHKLYGTELMNKIKSTTEVTLESEALGLRGIADRIDEENGKLVVYELKTGKAPSEGAWPNHRIQLAAYMMMLKEKGNNVEGSIDYSGDIRKIALNPFIEDEIKTLTKTVSEIIKTKKVPNCQKSENKCKSCGLKKYCDHLQQ